MTNIDKGRVEVSGELIVVLAEFTSAIAEVNERCNKIPGVEKDTFLKLLLEGLERTVVGGDIGA